MKSIDGLRPGVVLHKHVDSDEVHWNHYTLEDPAGRALGDAVRRLFHQVTARDANAAALETLHEGLQAILAKLEKLPPRKLRRGTAKRDTDTDVYLYETYSPLRGILNPIAPPTRIWIDDDVTRGSVTFDTAYEGPPGHVHGGYIAAMFDELLGAAQTLSKKPGFTGTLEIRYLAPTPLHRELTLEARHTGSDGRKVFVEGKIYAGDRLAAQAKGTFIAPAGNAYEYLDQMRKHTTDGDSNANNTNK